MKTLHKIILSIYLISLSGIAQRSSEIEVNLPVSPETFQFKKNLINKVSLYTGQPEITYEYDTFNRLKLVRDKDNNVPSENQYNYRTQN